MNKIKENIYNIARNHVRNNITSNLGKVVEDDEKITCYVKKSKIKKKNNSYTIACFGIEEKQKKLANAYKLNKPIHYVIDGLDFKKHKVYIFGYNNCDEVIIKNCNFELDVCIDINGKCTLDNTHIKTFSYLSIGAKELTIKNMNKNQIEAISVTPNIQFGADDKLNIINSNIGNKNTKLSFFAINELNIINSKIVGNEVICKSNLIKSDESSSITAKDKVDLKIDDFEKLNITAPTIVLNNDKISNEKETVVLKKVTNPLTIKRLELIKVLKKVKNECKKVNSEKIEEYRDLLSNQTISKVLKK